MNQSEPFEQDELTQLKAELDACRARCQDYARHDYLVRLLRGGYSVSDNAASGSAQSGISFPGTAFAVLLIHVEDINTHFLETNDASQAGVVFSTIDMLMKQLFGAHYEVYSVATGFDITGILCQPAQLAQFSPSDEAFLQRKSQELVESAGAAGISAYVVFSDLHDGIEGIQTAFQEVTDTENYRKFMGLEQRVLFSRHYSTDSLYQEPSANELPAVLDLLIHTAQGQYLEADRALAEYIETVMARHTPTTESYMLQYYGFGYLMFLCVDTINREHAAAGLEYLLRPESLFRGLPYPVVAERMSRLFQLLADESPKNAMPRWIDEVYRYIQRNYRDSNVNINTIADSFSMNAAYLSRAFRKNTGKSILEELNSLRLREAKRLMLSGASAESAALKSGFGSTITMRRYFKRYENCNPSELSD